MQLGSLFPPKLQIRSLLGRKDISMQGRSTVVSTFALSSLTYLASSLPLPNEIEKTLSKLIWTFIWNGSKKDRVARSTTSLPKQQGGLNLCLIHDFMAAIRLRLLQRFQTMSSPWSLHLAHLLSSCSGQWQLSWKELLAARFPTRQLQNSLPLFWKQTIKDWQRSSQKSPKIK